MTSEKSWKAEEEAQLLELRATGLAWTVVAKRLSRTEASVISHMGKMKTGPANREVLVDRLKAKGPKP